MLEAGVPLIVVKNFLGHVSLQTTQIYTEVNGKQPLHGEDLRAYVERLLPWREDMQERFLAEDPFECKSYTSDEKAVWC